jgi:Fe-S-cluster containining protein
MNGSKNGEETFYTKGLQFECLNCGRCCTGFPGYVYLSERDIARASGFLRMGGGEFVERHTRIVTVFHERRLSLTERKNFDCVFWKDGCTIYPARPYQCGAFPFWKRHLVSRREWEKTASTCRGIDRGRVYSRLEIERFVRDVPVYDIDRLAMPIR